MMEKRRLRFRLRPFESPQRTLKQLAVENSSYPGVTSRVSMIIMMTTTAGSSQPPVHRLPYDAFHIIFTMCSNPSNVSFPIIASHVCRLWRWLIFDMPGFGIIYSFIRNSHDSQWRSTRPGYRGLKIPRCSSQSTKWLSQSLPSKTSKPLCD